VNALLRDRRFGREPPDHTRPRDLVLRAFTRRRIAALAPGIAALAAGLADRIEAPEADLLPGLRPALAGHRDRPPSRRAGRARA
jgi:cytochrome P450